MYNYSTDFYNELNKDNRDFLIKMALVVKDLSGNSVSLNVTNENIFQGTFKVDSATSEVGEFCVGTLVASKLAFSLYNKNDVYSEYDFVDGTISLQVGMIVNGVEEVANYGKYVIANANFSDNMITIEALDNLSKLARPYVGGITFPTTLNMIIANCASACGVDLDASSVPTWASGYYVNTTDLSSETYANIVGYCAQIIGRYARADHNGRLSLGWYNLSAIADDLDGGTFSTSTTPYSDGDSADGGSFAYNDGDNVEGGNFRGLMQYHIVNETATADIDTDDVTITGVKVISSPQDNEEEVTCEVGDDAYTLVIEDNPFIANSKAQTVANRIYSVVAGMKFRPLSVSVLSNPAYEAGDVGVIADYRGNYYRCYFSNVSFQPDNYSSISCDAMSVNRQASASATLSNQIIQKAKTFVANEKSAREIALDTLSALAANSLGFFSTDVTQTSGGTIRYMHNKPLLSQSDTLWKITEAGFVVSTDYGNTWNAGFDASGNAVVNVLSAIGINAEWIKVGTLEGQTLQGGLVDGGRIQSVGSDGQSTVIEGGTISTNNANITGGTINIATDSTQANIILGGTKQTMIFGGQIALKEGTDNFSVTHTPSNGYQVNCGILAASDYITEGGTKLSQKYYQIPSSGFVITSDDLASTGDSTHPIYFDANGNPVQCTPSQMEVYKASQADNASTALRSTYLGSSSVGSSSQPIYLNSNGYPVACGNLTAYKMASDAGSPTSGSGLSRSAQACCISNGVPTSISGYTGNVTVGSATLHFSNGLLMYKQG